MKRALTILALATAPLLLVADEPAKTSTKTSTATSTAAEPARPKVISADPVATTDSPLVAAARRTNRAKKSAHRITNANLGKYGATSARITTSSNAELIVVPAPDTTAIAEQKANATRAAERTAALLAEAQKKAKEDAEKKLKAALAAERAEEGMYGETDADSGYGDGSGTEPTDPATQEKKPPQG